MQALEMPRKSKPRVRYKTTRYDYISYDVKLRFQEEEAKSQARLLSLGDSHDEK
jgi:hypothetical protein